ncbi:MAG: hypothetical protein WCH98_21750 [Verrucomicrobiota bacterium]
MTLELIERLSGVAGKRGLEFLLIGGHAVIHRSRRRIGAISKRWSNCTGWTREIRIFEIWFSATVARNRWRV